MKKRILVTVAAVVLFASVRRGAADVPAMRYVESSREQGATGAIAVDSTLSLRLGGGQARIDDDGTRTETTADAQGHARDTTQEWRYAWQGTAQQQGDVLTLRLSLADNSCSRTVKDHDATANDGNTSTSSSTSSSTSTSTSSNASRSTSGNTGSVSSECGQVDKSPTLVCHGTGLRVDASHTDEVWQCTSPTGKMPAGTSVAWAFGKKTCVAASSGRNGRQYSRCTR